MVHSDWDDIKHLTGQLCTNYFCSEETVIFWIIGDLEIRLESLLTNNHQQRTR